MPRGLPNAAWLAVLALGCDRVDADYTLRLVPRLPLDQRPFDADPSVKLVLTDDLRGSQILALDPDDEEPLLRSEGNAPLAATWAGLLLEVPARDSTVYDPASLHAWGETGPFDLADEGAEIDAEVLVAEFGAVGDLDLLPVGTAAFGAALALSPSGDAWLFGGADALDDGSTPALARMLRLHDLDAGDWRFEDAGTMPSVEGMSARFAATANVVETELGTAVLVTGGRSNGADPTGNIDTAFLLEPDTGEVLWTAAAMQVARSEHRSVVMDNGRVLLVGGYEAAGDEPAAASFEVFDPTWQAFDPGGERLTVPARGFALADLGPNGSLVCGGWTPDEGEGRGLSNACDRVSILGNVQGATPMPAALRHLAMAPVGDGLVLACGGIDDAGVTGDAWLYDIALDGWAAIDPMNHARAAHTILATPDGRALVLGGTTAVDEGLDAVGEAVECVELFDPQTRTFTEVECTATGSGAWPLTSVSPRGMALVVSGVGDGGGRDYGVVGLGPDL